MDEEEGGGIRLSKRFSDKGGEVDYKTKAGTAWSHSYLNQKPWHPLSYPNQRRKWIAEQTHAQKQSRSEEVAREYAQEQEFFRQTALVSKKEKEKMEMMKAVSFMYVRPPGYNAESAKAAEVEDEKKKQEPSAEETSTSMKLESMPPAEEKKKRRPTDVFGRALPTEEQFEVLKNAPRLETGAPARSKPFGVEIRNVKCLRCGNYGHQSGDRECPLKDAIMPNEESRLKRDDPLTAILAQTDSGEPLKWELKQKPGLSPPRGGFNPDDPNQQIVAEDIFDEYGGFLGGDNIPELLLSSSKPKKKKSNKIKHRKQLSPTGAEISDRKKVSTCGDDRGSRTLKKKRHKKSQKHSESRSPENSDSNVQYDHREIGSSSGHDWGRRLKKRRHKKSRKHSESSSPESSDSYVQYHDREIISSSSDDGMRRSSKKKTHKRKSHKYSESSSSEKSDSDRHHKESSSYRHSRLASSENSDSDGHYRKKHHHYRHCH